MSHPIANNVSLRPSAHVQPLRHGRHTRAVLVTAGACAACVMWLSFPANVHAQGVSLLANDALKVLLRNEVGVATGPPETDAAPPSAMAASPDGSRATYRVRRGETLDRVIAATMRDSVLNKKVLRKAFVALNPEAFPRGTPHIILSGALLQIPTITDLRTLAGAKPGASVTSSSGGADKRNWVRFP